VRSSQQWWLDQLLPSVVAVVKMSKIEGQFSLVAAGSRLAKCFRLVKN